MNDRWYIVRQVGGRHKKLGPTTLEQLRQLADAGKLRPDDLACVEGMESWVRVAELEPLLRPQPSPPTLPALPLVRTAHGWPEPVVRADCRPVARSAPARESSGFSWKPVVLVGAGCLATALVAVLVIALVSSKQPDRQPTVNTVVPVATSSPGTIRFAL